MTRDAPPADRRARRPGALPGGLLGGLRGGLLGGLLDGVVSLAAPPACAGCGAPGVALCRGCAAALDGPGFRVPAAAALAVPGRAHAPPAAACAPYEGAVPTLVNAWKERGRHDLAPVLGAALARAVAVLLAEPDAGPGARDGVVLVPVPSTPAARRRRGADGVREVAGHAAAVLEAAGVPARVLPALRVVRRVADQSGLSAAGRAANVAGAFGIDRRALARRVAGRRAGGPPALAAGVVVVDDVLTTGATLRSAACALAMEGAVVDGYACVAATPLRRTQSASVGTGPTGLALGTGKARTGGTAGPTADVRQASPIDRRHTSWRS